eukprot:g13343.t1
MINTDLKDIIELASKSPYAMAFFDYTIGKVPPIELIQLSEKNKVKKQRTKIKDVIDGGWQYYSSLKKVKKKMKKISLRRSHIDRWKKDELEFYDHFTKYVILGKPLFIQKVIDYNNVAFQEQFHRKNFVQNYGGVALYRVNGKKIRISHIVENMRLRQDEFCREMKSTDQHNINNLVVETSNLNLDYSFLNLSYLFNAKGLFIIETNRNNVTLNNKNISHTTMENTTLSIACSLSYKTFQRHSYGMWYLVLFGRRKWILFPPQTNKDYFQQKEKQFNDYFKAKYVSEETVGKDDDNIVELLHMNGLEGLQEQGEVFYIPTGWFYAYINIGETLVLRNTVGNVLSCSVRKKTEGGIDDKKKKKKIVPGQKYYCHHYDSCGVRTLRGPSTVDSLQNGHMCICNGAAENGHVGKCFHGTCYDRKAGSKRRDDADLDSHGLCEYTAGNVVAISQCELKKEAKHDPNTYFYIDNGLSANMKQKAPGK